MKIETLYSRTAAELAAEFAYHLTRSGKHVGGSLLPVPVRVIARDATHLAAAARAARKSGWEAFKTLATPVLMPYRARFETRPTWWAGRDCEQSGILFEAGAPGAGEAEWVPVCTVPCR